MADLSVEQGAEDGAELVLSIRQIAERFIHLYWQHASPYGTGRAGSTPGILVQNMGAQAAVLSAIAEIRGRTGASSPHLASNLPDYGALVSKVTLTVSAQPLNYLQNFGGVTDPFIYEREGRGNIRLKLGVAYCFRRFYPLVQQLSRSHWVDHIKSNRRNHAILGDSGDLDDFLFSTSRQSLTIIGAGLRKLDGHQCFYCGHVLNEADVDHYIPFSLYPRDLAHNFVLAHPTCNRSKSDTLAAKFHLERWLNRLLLRSDDLAEIGTNAGITVDDAATRHVATWAYTSAYKSDARAWLAAGQFEAVTDGYLRLFRAPQP